MAQNQIGISNGFLNGLKRVFNPLNRFPGLLSGLELLLAALDRGAELCEADAAVAALVARPEDPLRLLGGHVLHHLQGREREQIS